MGDGMPLRVDNTEITQLFVDGRECKVLVVNGVPCFGKKYTLSSGGTANSTVTINRTSSPNQHAPTGNIASGAAIYEGDVLQMSVTANTDCVYAELYANIGDGGGERKRASDFTFTVCGDVSFRSTARSAILFEGEKVFGYIAPSPVSIPGMTADMKIAITGKGLFNEMINTEGNVSYRQVTIDAVKAELPTDIWDNGASVEITRNGDKLQVKYNIWQGPVKGKSMLIMPCGLIITQVRIVE